MKMRFFLAIALVCLPMFVVAQSNDVISQGAKTFMDQYWSKVSAPNAIAFPYIDSAVADQINFYGQSMSRAKFFKTETAFLDRWPERHYTVQPGSETINCDDGQSTCELTGGISLNASSPDRGVATIAEDQFDFTLKYETVDGKITFRIIKVAGTGGSGQVTYLTTGSVPYESLNLPDAQIQAIGCPDFDYVLHKPFEAHAKCNAVAAIDLGAIYHTTARWQFVATQANNTDNNLQFTFLKDGAPVQVSANSAKFSGEYSATQLNYCWPNDFRGASIVYPTKDANRPLLVVNADCSSGAPNQPEFIGVWAYNLLPQKFSMIWESITECGEDARFFTSGSLAGYVVSDTDGPMNENGQVPPYSDINVYRLTPDQHLISVLHYHHFFKPAAAAVEGTASMDSCGYDDPFSGVDSELPTIFARLGLSHH